MMEQGQHLAKKELCSGCAMWSQIHCLRLTDALHIPCEMGVAKFYHRNLYFTGP